MSKELRGKYRLYDGTIKRLLAWTGLAPLAEPSVGHRLLPGVHCMAALLMSCAILNFCRHHFANLNLFLKGLGLALSFLTVIQKTICLTLYRKRLVRLDASLAAAFDRDFQDAELRPILLSPLPWFYRPSLIQSSVTWAVIVLYWIAPIIIIAVQLSRGVVRLKYVLPFPALYPWRIEPGGWLYALVYVFEIYAGICLGSFTSSIDSLFGYYIFQISGQLRTLSHRLGNLSARENYRKVLNECVSRHQILTRCQDHLERIYGPIVLWMLLTSAMVMCALIYQASHMTPGKAAIVGVYILMKSGQTLLYGWFGTFLTNENNTFREAIYASDWPGSGEKCLMTDILVMMTYKPFVLKACTLSTISVDMFVAVSNTALSYFFMLRTLEEEE